MSPEDLRAPHHATLIGREVGARMHRVAIVPNQEIAHVPLVTIDELLPLGMIEYGAQELLTLSLSSISSTFTDISRLT